MDFFVLVFQRWFYYDYDYDDDYYFQSPVFETL